MKNKMTLDILREDNEQREFAIRRVDSKRILEDLAVIRKRHQEPAVIKFCNNVILQEHDLWEIQVMMNKINRGVA